MKLYSTITSERATKGQGGNEFIGITLMNEKKEVFGSISVWPSEDVLIRIHGQKFDIQKNKDGNITCECGNKFRGIEDKEDTCPKCMEKIIKGKKQKGNN